MLPLHKVDRVAPATAAKFALLEPEPAYQAPDRGCTTEVRIWEMLGNRKDAATSKDAVHLLNHEWSVIYLAEDCDQQDDINTAIAQRHMFRGRGQKRDRQAGTWHHALACARQHSLLWVDEDELTARKTCGNMCGDHAGARTEVEHARARLQSETLDQTIGAEQLSSKRMLEEKSKSSWTALWYQKHVSMAASEQNRPA